MKQLCPDAIFCFICCPKRKNKLKIVNQTITPTTNTSSEGGLD